MKLTITSPDWQREQQFAASFAKELDTLEKNEVMEESLQAEGKIKEAMPVDTGRARSSWGHWTPQLMVKDNELAKSLDAIWKVENGGLAITQGTEVPYVQDLNEGSSRQAPAGFVDAIALLALEDLEKGIGDGAENLWRSG